MRFAPCLALLCAALVVSGCGIAGASRRAVAGATIVPLSPTPVERPEPTITAGPITREPDEPSPAATSVPDGWRPPPGDAVFDTSVGAAPITHGDRNVDAVYLTFDDGYGFGEEVLAVLRQKHAPATACFAGSFMPRNPSFIRHWVEAGFSVCNHTYWHGNLTRLTNPTGDPAKDEPHRFANVQAELTTTVDKLHEYAPDARVLPLFRPPYGAYDDLVSRAAAAAGYRMVLWSLDPEDWRPATTAVALRDRVLAQARPGDIILFHFERHATVEALPAIIDGLRAKGLEPRGLESLALP